MDILIDDTYNLLIENGDFIIGDNISQQQQLLLATNKGDWKENPLIGCGLANYINDENIEKMKYEIMRQYKADGLIINDITINNNEELIINAERS
jgi:hypothetical protein